MSKKKIWIVSIVLFVVLLGIIGVYSQLRRNENEKNTELRKEQLPLKYDADAYIVQPVLDSNYLEFRGTAYADKLTTINATSSGVITYANIAVGKQVSTGETLIRIDASTLKQNEAQVKNEYKNALQNYNSLSELQRYNNATNTEVNDAKLRIQSASSQLNIIRHQLTQTTIQSPISGIIVEKKINSSEFINSGEPIATIANLSSVLIKIFVNQNVINNITMGHAVAIIADAFPSDTIKGIVESKIPIGAEAGNYPVNIRVYNHLPKMILDRMTAKVIYINKAPTLQLKIPRNAIVHQNNKLAVYLYNKNNKPTIRNIEVENLLTDLVNVKGGLNQGDTILVSGLQNIQSNTILRNIHMTN